MVGLEFLTRELLIETGLTLLAGFLGGLCGWLLIRWSPGGSTVDVPSSVTKADLDNHRAYIRRMEQEHDREMMDIQTRMDRFSVVMNRPNGGYDNPVSRNGMVTQLRNDVTDLQLRLRGIETPMNNPPKVRAYRPRTIHRSE